MAHRNRNRPSRLSPAPENLEWPDDITSILIQQRRRHQHLFAELTQHDRLWTRIANHIRSRYNFEVSARQCQVKWYTIKRGYENLRRIMSDDLTQMVTKYEAQTTKIGCFINIYAMNFG